MGVFPPAKSVSAGQGRARDSGAAGQLEAIAACVRGLRPCWHDPESFFAEKDALAAELRRLARALEYTT